MALRGRNNAPHPSSERPTTPREVNNLLHTLRGEQFRHTQNVRRGRNPTSAIRASLSLRAPTGPSLPYAEIYGSSSPPAPPRAPERVTSGTDAKPAAGPVPRSWAVPAPKDEGPAVDSAAWRAQALALIFKFAAEPSSGAHHADATDGRLPPLTQICLRVLLHHYGAQPDTMRTLAAHMAPHICRQLLRLTAVHAPLPDASLYALLGPAGHVDGEAIVVGPHATPRTGLFRAGHGKPDPDEHEHEHEQQDSGMPTSEPAREWDAPADADDWAPQAISTLALLCTPLSVRALLALPPSLTALALVRLPTPVPVHRLQEKCPLLEVLDLSFNEWLRTPMWGEERALQRVAWRSWGSLRVLGVRGCGLEREVLREVNEGRWVDVEIVV
ncbi:hypothetical protein FA95DRAFT_1551962 [Auriscalpium vulgare]|uniref:Uncharacterized protein n=1 Tax=Auriscalpium vulgare TaxID=40419 RepID=A0ACB8SCG6_9AGAM|nr:hypothetical protein FA95DRAFT_1551962 [Auriscalpium vulgare]